MIKTIWKIIGAFEQNGLRIKWFWKPEWSDDSKALLNWFKPERSDSVPV